MEGAGDAGLQLWKKQANEENKMLRMLWTEYRVQQSVHKLWGACHRVNIYHGIINLVFD